MNDLRAVLAPVYHGMAMGVLAMLLGGLWAVYLATHHEALHGGFEAQMAQAELAEQQQSNAEMKMDGMEMSHPHSDDASTSHGHDDGAAAHPHAASAHGGKHQHSHSGNVAMDAMQRLLRGHIHFVGIGMLSIVALILVASTSLKGCWKTVFGWTFGLGALLYPPAWILMGFRTVELGPQSAEASVLWLFGPAVGLLIGSLMALIAVLMIEYIGLSKTKLFKWAFSD